jgi:hypothetical protein
MDYNREIIKRRIEEVEGIWKRAEEIKTEFHSVGSNLTVTIATRMLLNECGYIFNFFEPKTTAAAEKRARYFLIWAPSEQEVLEALFDECIKHPFQDGPFSPRPNSPHFLNLSISCQFGWICLARIIYPRAHSAVIYREAERLYRKKIHNTELCWRKLKSLIGNDV